MSRVAFVFSVIALCVVIYSHLERTSILETDPITGFDTRNYTPYVRCGEFKKGDLLVRFGPPLVSKIATKDGNLCDKALDIELPKGQP